MNPNRAQDLSVRAQKSFAKALEDSMEYLYKNGDKEFHNGDNIGLEVERYGFNIS